MGSPVDAVHPSPLSESKIIGYRRLQSASRIRWVIIPYNLDRDSEGQYQHMSIQRRSAKRVEREFFAARPIKPDLGVLGRKWALLILADIGLRRVDRFSSLLRSNPRLNPRILSRRLRELEETGMIKRMEENLESRTIVRWGMTEKGVDILPAIIRLIVFGARWHAENQFQGKPPRKLVLVSTRADTPRYSLFTGRLFPLPSSLFSKK